MPRRRATRRLSLLLTAFVSAPIVLSAPAGKTVATPASVVETSLADLRIALEQKRTTSREIVQQYLTRIATYEDELNVMVAVNPQALAVADSRTVERYSDRAHGQPPGRGDGHLGWSARLRRLDAQLPRDGHA